MLLGLFAAIAVAPLYWLAVPVRWRREALSLGSLTALAIYDVRLLPLLAALTLGITAALQAISRSRGSSRQVLGASAVAALLALFVWNKFTGHGFSVLPSQGGVVFIGLSFLVLKAAGVIIESARGTLRDARLRDVLAWIVFLPTYPSGPMETFDHFRSQWSTWNRPRVADGLERILFGLVKALVFAHLLGAWVEPLVAAPSASTPAVLLLGLYAMALRFYFDLAGYSDIAIGLAALYGYEIAENFDRPFAARNLALLWQRWHMTLTGWLRTYAFTPVTRALMRRLGPAGDRAAIAVGLIATMLLIALWHGLSWNFVVYGLLQGLAVVWVSVVARDLGRRVLPHSLVRWWRGSRVGYAGSVAMTFNFFAVTSIFSVTDVESALHYLRAFVGM